ncbi:PTS transporter subunit EIIC [Metabacillus niabensis]|uniref:PTS system sucrose-specific IIC component n=1 Tax=Metabacillus niabensis TaxID=324854 RepID=A0ABT9Z0M2_9BACI|nr:PTS transporter subunit EIIC [Metabacillus niabensis]MDQ0225808.1 PTS system sucrose-specific IIC component [Metabacillus niabensis]
MSNKYNDISKDLEKYVGGKDNIQRVTHCATRLRLVLKDNSKADMKKIEGVRLAKGAFVAGDQLQIVFGAGLVNGIHEELVDYLQMDKNMEGIQKTETFQKQNPFQKFIKSISDVFIEIMPCILAAALLMGLTSLLSTQGLFGKQSIVEHFPAVSGLNNVVSIASSGIFAFLPLIVAYSATKRFGGRPALGLAIGAIMVHPNLADAFQVASGNASADVANVFGLKVELVGFQGGIIIALMIGFVVALLDKYFNRVLPDIIKFVFTPMLTILVSSLLLFTIIGPFGRLLGDGLTNSLLWMAENLGVFGYMIFAGVQQIIVISGLHHTFGAIEGQLLANTGRDFLNPLMSVAIVAQGGAVLGYMYLHFKNKKTKEICISAFVSILFGISEPAIFGVNLKYKYPLIAGCIASSLAGAYVFFTQLTSVGFGTTGLPAFTIVDPANNGYLHFVISHLIALALGIIFAYGIGKIYEKKKSTEIIIEKDKSKKMVDAGENI